MAGAFTSVHRCKAKASRGASLGTSESTTARDARLRVSARSAPVASVHRLLPLAYIFLRHRL